MDQPSLEFGSGADILSQAIRAIRKKRGLGLAEVAEAMQMSRRTYEEFEGGRGRLTHERIFAFANATNADPFALLLCADFRSAQFAIDCADTKLAYILVSHLHDFWEAEGGDIGRRSYMPAISGLYFSHRVDRPRMPWENPRQELGRAPASAWGVHGEWQAIRKGAAGPASTRCCGPALAAHVEGACRWGSWRPTDAALMPGGAGGMPGRPGIRDRPATRGQCQL